MCIMGNGNDPHPGNFLMKTMNPTNSGLIYLKDKFVLGTFHPHVYHFIAHDSWNYPLLSGSK